MGKNNIVHLRTYVKSYIIEYIKSWFGGENFDKFQAVCPRCDFGIYIDDAGFSPKRKFAIGQFYKTHAIQVPAILVSDQGANLRTDLIGLGGGRDVRYDPTTLKKQIQEVQIWDFSLNIYAIEKDLESLGVLISLLSSIFYEMSRWSGIPSSDRGTWTIAMLDSDFNWGSPNEWTPDGATLDKIFYSILSLNVRAEGMWFWETSGKVRSIIGSWGTEDKPHIVVPQEGDVFPAGQWLPIQIDPPTIGDWFLSSTNGVKLRKNEFGTGWEMWGFVGEATLFLTKRPDPFGEAVLLDKVTFSFV